MGTKWIWSLHGFLHQTQWIMSFILLVRNLVQFRRKFLWGATCKIRATVSKVPTNLVNPWYTILYHVDGAHAFGCHWKKIYSRGPTPDMALNSNTWVQAPALKRSSRNLSWKGRWQPLIGLSKNSSVMDPKLATTWGVPPPNPRLLRQKPFLEMLWTTHISECVYMQRKTKQNKILKNVDIQPPWLLFSSSLKEKDSYNE